MFRAVAAASFIRAATATTATTTIIATKTFAWVGHPRITAAGTSLRTPSTLSSCQSTTPPRGFHTTRTYFGPLLVVGGITDKQSIAASGRIARLVRHMSAGGEAERAKAAATEGAAVTDDTETLFDKIVDKRIPADIVHEDDLCLAFRDVNPQAPKHFLVIPKKRDGLSQLSKAMESNKPLLGHLMFVAQQVAKEQGMEEGFRVVVNDGVWGSQSVYHLHLHVMGGRQMSWPPG